MAMRKLVCWFGFALLISLSASAYADLDTAINRAILKATAHDTSRTDKEKLYENRCETIARYLGFEDDPTGHAIEFSCDVPGIGIALYAGDDLGKHPPEKIGQYFVDALAKEGLKAQVFIKPNHRYGSSVAFYVNGYSWLDYPIDPLSGTKKIDVLVAEAKLILFTEGRVSEWQYRPKNN